MRRGAFRSKKIIMEKQQQHDTRAVRLQAAQQHLESVSSKIDDQVGQIKNEIAAKTASVESKLSGLDSALAANVRAAMQVIAEQIVKINQRWVTLEQKLAALEKGLVAVVLAVKGINDIGRAVSDAKASTVKGIADVGQAVSDAKASTVRIVEALEPPLKLMANRLDKLSKRKDPPSEDSINTIASALSEILDKIDSVVENQTPPKETASPDLTEILNYIKSPKKVTRDSDGNIVGWRLDSTIH